MNQLYTLKLLTGELIIGELLDLDPDSGSYVISYPLRVMQGMSDTGEHFVLVKHDPTAEKQVFPLGSEFVVTIAKTGERFKRFYIQTILKYQLVDGTHGNPADALSDLYDSMYLLCGKFKVTPNDDLLPVAKSSFGVTTQ